MANNKPKITWKKVWWFIWEDESIWSWIANAAIAFVLIKFLVYPGLGFMLDTNYPIVAVVSGSMEHKIAASPVDPTGQFRLCGKVFDEKHYINFDEYWDTCKDWYLVNTNISKQDFRNVIFHNGFNTGDIMILVGEEPEDLKTGDVIVYKTARPDPIIHRIVNIVEENGSYYFQTKGDHNPGSNGDEYKIAEEQLIGKAVFRIPLLGWIKIGFVKLLVTINIIK